MKRYLVTAGGGRRRVTPRRSAKALTNDEMRHAVGSLYPEAEYLILSPMQMLQPGATVVAVVTVHISDSPDGVGRVEDKFFEWLVARKEKTT